MTQRRILRRLAVIAALYCLTAGTAFAAAQRLALLIGINDYLANDLGSANRGEAWVPEDLRGAVNDVQSLRQVLLSRYGFADGNIEMLVDRQATRQEILGALGRLAERAGPEDVVYIHFSGHGSQVADRDGDEDDGLDETILPQDARTGDVRDITDDELGALVGAIGAGSVLVALDSCHSGTATRGGSGVRTRMVLPDPRSELYATPAVRGGGALPQTANYVLMTGAASNQPALDGPVGNTYFGFFSWALAKSLGNAPEGASAETIHAAVGREFAQIASKLGLIAMPDPQLEAPPGWARRAVLQAPTTPAATAPASPPAPEETARLPWAAVRPSAGGVQITGAVPLGAEPGSLWAIYPPGETDFETGLALALATVTEIAGDDAVASVEPAGANLPDTSRAILLAPPPGAEAIPVRLDRVQAGLRPGLAQAVHEALARRQGPAIELVGPDQFARYLVDVTDGTCHVFAAGGLQEVASFPAADLAVAGDRIAELLARSQAVEELLALDNPTARLALSVEVLAFDESGQPLRVETGDGTEAPSYRVRAEGESRSSANSLTLEVRSSAEAYLTIVDVDSEGGINLLFPNPLSEEAGFHPSGLVQGGESIRIPDSLDAGNRAGFHWDYSPPSGLDTIRVFASAELETAERIRAFIGAAAGSRTRGAARRSSLSELRRELAQTTALRGIRVVASETEQPQAPPASSPPVADWTAASVTLLVQE